MYFVFFSFGFFSNFRLVRFFFRGSRDGSVILGYVFLFLSVIVFLDILVKVLGSIVIGFV